MNNKMIGIVVGILIAVLLIFVGMNNPQLSNSRSVECISSGCDGPNCHSSGCSVTSDGQGCTPLICRGEGDCTGGTCMVQGTIPEPKDFDWGKWLNRLVRVHGGG